MTKIDKVLHAARAFGENNNAIDEAATLKIVGLPMYGRDGCERWLVRADAQANSPLLVDVELMPSGQVRARQFVF